MGRTHRTSALGSGGVGFAREELQQTSFSYLLTKIVSSVLTAKVLG